MKYPILFIVSILLFSCNSTQTLIDPVTNQKVKVFENEEFTFKYPKDWVEFGDKPTILNKLAQISPKREFRVVNKTKSKLVFKQGETVKNKANDYSSFNRRTSFNRMTIYKTNVKNINFEKYIEVIKKMSKDINNRHTEYEYSYLKKSKNYCIQNRTIRPSKNTNIRIVAMNLTNHFIKHGAFIYKISFMFKVEKEKEYLDDAAYILNSFKFTDGTPLK